MLGNPEEIAEMAEAYIECALFTADEEIVAPESGPFDKTPYMGRVTNAMKSKALSVCTDFVRANITDLLTYPAVNAGHDLWYTRNGHGCGFWEKDFCTAEEEERLTHYAHELGECRLESIGRWFYFE